MYVVIFRATGRSLDAECSAVAARMREIAEHLGVHAVTVSRGLRQAEQAIVGLKDLTLTSLDT